MKDEELKAQINDIIEGEIQNGINDYLEAQEEKEDSGVGFVSEEAKELNVKVYQDQVDKLIKEYKQIKKFRKSNLGQVKKLGLVDLIGGEREAVKYLEEKKDIRGLPLVDWVYIKESSSVFDLIFREGDISSLGNNFLSNTGFRLYSILF